MKRILVINLGGIGDILLSAPAQCALRARFPDTKITLLVPSRTQDAASFFKYVDNTYAFYLGYGGIMSFFGLIRNIITLMELRSKNFDLGLNMRTLVSDKSAKKIEFLLDIIKPKLKAGRDTEGRGDFFDIKIPETEQGQKYEMEYDIDTVRALGINIFDKKIDLEIEEKNRNKINKMLRIEGIGMNDILIGIHPGGMSSRRWPIENFSKVIDRTHKKIPCKFVITGDKNELSLAKRLMKIANVKIINFVGRLNIKKLGALIKRCNLFISNDTGPMHIAAILKTPLVAIFGPGDIRRYDPRNISEKVIVLYKKADCAPCNKARCDSVKCLKAISSEEAVEAILKLLNT